MRPSTRWNAKIGRKAMMMIALEKSIGWPSSIAVFFSALSRHIAPACAGLWSSRPKASFTIRASTSTTALSTIIPKSIAPSDMRLADTPRASIRMNAKRSDRGITVATMSEAFQLRRKIISTPITSSAPTVRFSITVFTVCSIRSLRW